MNDTEILKLAIDTYGDKSQIDKSIEEMTELTKALLKHRYIQKPHQRDILEDAVAEEMADVMIMLEQLRMIYRNDDRIAHYRQEKMDRLARLLAKGERDGYV